MVCSHKNCIFTTNWKWVNRCIHQYMDRIVLIYGDCWFCSCRYYHCCCFWLDCILCNLHRQLSTSSSIEIASLAHWTVVPYTQFELENLFVMTLMHHQIDFYVSLCILCALLHFYLFTRVRSLTPKWLCFNRFCSFIRLARFTSNIIVKLYALVIDFARLQLQFQLQFYYFSIASISKCIENHLQLMALFDFNGEISVILCFIYFLQANIFAFFGSHLSTYRYKQEKNGRVERNWNKIN